MVKQIERELLNEKE